MKAVVGALTPGLLAVATVWAQSTGTAEDNLKRRNITLPPPATPIANYVPAVRVGNLLFVSGTGPGPSTPLGKVGKDLSREQGYQAARSTGLNLLATVRATLGSLDKVKRIVKSSGW
jgi:enamine deaminase RidA (YjgF/YER057c/UK114 family)